MSHFNEENIFVSRTSLSVGDAFSSLNNDGVAPLRIYIFLIANHAITIFRSISVCPCVCLCVRTQKNRKLRTKN